MADEFQTGICSGNWWNSTRNEFSGGSSPCSTALNDMGSFGWSTEMEAKARSCEESVSVSGSSIIFQDTHKPQEPDSVSGSAILMDSTVQMMGFNLSSPTIDWNQALLRSSGRAESNFQSMLQDEISLNSGDSSGDCTVTCQGLPTSFPTGSSSYGCSSTLLQGLFEPDPQPRQPRYENQSLNYDSSANYSMNSNELSPSWPKFSHFLKASSPPKQQPTNHLHFSNNTPFWNASATSMNDTRSSSSFLPTLQTQFFTQKFEEKSNSSNLIAVKTKINEVRDSCSVVKKNNSEPPMKRTRIETPSPLPTFKVRKEKLGDRITALQQLVSPFGKTDTASVLFEAIEYIKFLHDQVSVLSTPYMKNGAQIQHQQNFDISKDAEGAKQDLRSRGLCLVPISSTFPVTNETTADFWTPTFGVSYR